jgi:CHAT domain-containing protein
MWKTDRQAYYLWMSRFLYFRYNRGLDFVQAYQKVQLDFLRGNWALDKDTERLYKALSKKNNSSSTRLSRKKMQQFRHPYYWAGFVPVLR